MAYTFNGSTQYLSNNSSPLGNTPSSFSIACLVKGQPFDNRQFVAFGNSTSITPVVLFGTTGSIGRIRLFYRNDANSTIVTPLTPNAFLSSTTFKHACVTSDNATAAIYDDGVAAATANFGGATTTTLDRFAIGASLRTSPSLYFDGTIAEVGIWNAALTAAEVASLAKGMTCDKVRPQSLVFYAPLVRDLIDYKGGLTLTNNNSATVANHPRVYA